MWELLSEDLRLFPLSEEETKEAGAAPRRCFGIHYSIRAMGDDTKGSSVGPWVCVRPQCSVCQLWSPTAPSIAPSRLAAPAASRRKPFNLSFSFPDQVLLKNPLFAALTNQRLNGTGWTAELLANFLYNGPLDKRPAGMPPYDWRDVYNTTTRVLKLLSNFLGVSSQDEIPDEMSTSSLSSSLVLPLTHTHTHNRNPEVQ